MIQKKNETENPKNDAYDDDNIPEIDLPKSENTVSDKVSYQDNVDAE